MNYDVSKIADEKNFRINGASYIGKPKPHTVMFITNKVTRLLSQLESVDECLVFAEKGMQVPKQLLKRHCFVFSENPQLDYAKFAQQLKEEQIEEEKKLQYDFKEGSYLSKTARISKSAYIEPNCVIGHNVVIGENAFIGAGSTIKNAIIGSDFVANEHSVIGANGFTMAEDEHGYKYRIPTLGHVKIGNRVEVGAHDNISCGSGGDTIIENCVKLDALIHIGHDAHLKENVEITAGSIIGGFDILEESVYVGLNSVLRNRITVGRGAFIGMGSVVTKNIPANTTVVGNPARKFVEG